MEIKAVEVAKLRKMTGAGMMDCKKALIEANGDYEKAKEIIREKGKLVAAKRADRETSEGSVITIANEARNKAILMCLGCETDFVANTEGFRNLAQKIAEAALAAFPADMDAFKAVKLGDFTVEECVTQEAGKTGEKHALPYYAKMEAPYIATYIHINHKVAAMVGFNKEVSQELGKGIAMQVTAMNPVSISKDDCPKDIVAKELEIAVQKTKDEQIQKAVESALKKKGFNLYTAESEEHINEGIMKGYITEAQAQEIRDIKTKVAAEKAANLPEQMINNIAQGRLGKFFKEQTLEEQEYIMESKVSVKDFIKSQDPEAKVVAFYRFSLND